MMSPLSYPRLGISRLELQDHLQSFVDGMPQARGSMPAVRSGSGGPGSGAIHDRVADETHRVRWQQNIRWSVGELDIACNRGDDCGLNPAEIEGVRWDHKNRPLIPASTDPGSSTRPLGEIVVSIR